jgi:hypothetical protein
VSIFQTAAAARLVFVLGIVNLVFVTSILFTCRCLPTWSVTKPIMKHKWYQRVYKFHCYLWWILIPSVIVHAIFALGLYGVPF